MKRADAASGVERARLIAEAWAVPGIEPPNNYRNLVKAADPNDESGMVRRLHFDGWGLAQKYCGKESDGGLQLGDEATIAKMKEFLKDDAYTPEQKQVFYAIIIGVLNRGGGNAMLIKGNANEMKRLNPESNLGVTADQVIKLWGGGANGKK